MGIIRTIVFWGLYWGSLILGNYHIATDLIVDWGYIGILEKKMETTIVYWDYIRIMEKKMETTTLD